MKKLPLIKRAGNRFAVDESKILPYMRKSKGLIMSAIGVATEYLKENPDEFEGMLPKDKLEKLNDIVYEVLTDWGIYKG